MFEFISNFTEFIPVFVKTRYHLDLNVESYWPAFFVPKTYEDLQSWDAKGLASHTYFADHFQMYVTYATDIDTKHLTGGKDATGMCMVIKRGPTVAPEDFMFSEMPVFDPTLPVLGSMNPYRFYTDFSRLVLHELEHRLMAWKSHSTWISAVDALVTKPLVVWETGKVDSFGNKVIFASQQDPQ